MPIGVNTLQKRQLLNQTTQSKERFSQFSDWDEDENFKLTGSNSFMKRIISPRIKNDKRNNTVAMSSNNIHNYEVVFTNLQMNNTPRNPLSML